LHEPLQRSGEPPPPRLRRSRSRTPRTVNRCSLAYLGAAAAQDATAVVTEVMLIRLVGAALMNKPLMTTVWSLCCGKLNSDTPISRNSFFPAGAVVGTSFG